jgi:hypothetical protein
MSYRDRSFLGAGIAIGVITVAYVLAVVFLR